MKKSKNETTILSMFIVSALTLLLAFPFLNAQVGNVTLMTTNGQCPVGDSGTYPSCVATVLGCTNPSAANYNANATVDDGSCKSVLPAVYGCTNPGAANYSPSATVDDGSCKSALPVVYGCTNPGAANYNANATVDNGSCTP
jgi:hypothetical protein